MFLIDKFNIDFLYEYMHKIIFVTLSLGLHIEIDSPSGAAILNSAEVFLDACGVLVPDVTPK